MKAIVIGYGSVGRNRASILRELDIDIRAVDLDEIDNIDSILTNEQFDFGLVCSPSNLHLEHTYKLASHKTNFFCEKPYYSQINKNSTILDKIEEFVIHDNLINMVACNWRFSERVRQIPDDTKFIKVRWGYNLAQWRNDGKHHQLYSANYSMGGGVLTDAIHELDYLYYKFGKIKDIKIFPYRVSSMTVDTEDCVMGIIEFESGTTAIFELDYLSSVYQRYYEFLDKDDKLIKVDLIDNINNTNKSAVVDNYVKNLYHNEMLYFIDNVKNRTQCMNNVFEARYLLNKVFGC